ncbi:Ubiquitin carboxyl-terminal hydrolase Usp2 [Gryllus bimaculatus]|nr:Ubiquitin carboxyl-terminal hydrolase Usp2 [Gryllus bimaculatus]
MTRTARCPHVSYLSDCSQADIERAKEISRCSECSSQGPNLWLCLHRGCLRIGCSETQNDHSTTHNKNYRSHCLHLNLTTLRVWCYLCEDEVFLDHSDSVNTRSSLPTMRYGPADSGDSSDSEDSREDNGKPRGLTGLQNIGNTCYMNSALQALSNTPPLTRFFLDCGAFLHGKGGDKKPGLSKSYHRLVQEMWHRKRPGYVHPMFRGYQQHDTQEFLRCFMDQLHEELKEPLVDSFPDRYKNIQNHEESQQLAHFDDGSDEEDNVNGGHSSQSEGEYETCDSGVSERSSLSDEGERGRAANKRKLSRSPSPPQERMRSKLTTPSSKTHGSSPSSPTRPNRKKQPMKYRSIISDVFDGKVLSSVQCLTCDRISTRVETFQDLSLPIPSRDHIHMLHQGSLTPQKGGLSACSDVYTGEQGWVSWILEWVRSWFWGPTISLHDCLAAFFSADELKGDNMYSCEKCNKLRNGVKYSKVLELPEVLCVHLKRFRHELMFSSKISNYVSFPLEGLDMRPYLHKDCTSQVTSYDLVSVICHHGTAGGGHYTCYSLNYISDQWFEFDDQYVTQVTPETVQNCEAYVLFYKKSCDVIAKKRQRACELIDLSSNEPSLQFYVSKQWVNRFNTFAEPGPIDNSDFLCIHGGVHPSKAGQMDQLCTILTQPVWEYLYETFGGGPACNFLYACTVCLEEQEALQRRVKQELDEFLQLNKEFQADESPSVIYAISMSWFRQWQSFVRGKEAEPPGAIDNSPIIVNKNGQTGVKMGSDYAQLSEELWNFFHRIYGGGPEVMTRSPYPRGLSSGCSTASSGSRTCLFADAPGNKPTVNADRELIHSHKARSTENINIGFTNVTGRPVRAQSASSDNINLRMAALTASGHRKMQDGVDGARQQCSLMLGDSTEDETLSSHRNGGYCIDDSSERDSGIVISKDSAEELQNHHCSDHMHL